MGRGEKSASGVENWWCVPVKAFSKQKQLCLGKSLLQLSGWSGQDFQSTNDMDQVVRMDENQDQPFDPRLGIFFSCWLRKIEPVQASYTRGLSANARRV